MRLRYLFVLIVLLIGEGLMYALSFMYLAQYRTVESALFISTVLLIMGLLGTVLFFRQVDRGK